MTDLSVLNLLYTLEAIFFKQKHYCPNTNVSLEKGLMHNIAHNRVQKWKNVVDKRKVFRAFLTDLSKVFNGLSNDLIILKLIVKLNA